jgi:WD40 repeat protein
MGSQKGLMAVAASASPPTVTTIPRVTGRVLAISPDGKLAIVSDTSSAVQQVFVFNTASNTFTNFLISGATTAAFSPDSSKAYIVAGSKLYIYSAQATFQAAPLHAPGTDVAFLANGMFGYVAEGASGTDLLATCDDSSQALSGQVQSVAAPTSFLRPLNDGSGFVGLEPPNLTFINAAITPTTLPLPAGDSGCPVPFPTGVFTVANTMSAVDLGLGTFTPVAFLVSSDAEKVYIVVQNSPTIQVFDLLSQLPSTLTLVGSPNPLAAALAPDGQTLYVSGSDGKVHFVNTVSGGDVTQVAVPPSSLCTITTGGTQPNCLPDLLAVKP